MLNDLNETLKQMLVAGVPLDTSEIDVVFEAPTEEWSSSLARPTVNSYLYHLVENRELRHNDWEIDQRRRPGRSSNGNGGNNPPHVVARRHVPFRIDAHYMVTAWANEVEDEHRLLWRMLATFLRYQVIPSDVLQGDLAGEEWPIHLKVAQPESVMKNPADFWGGMEGHIKPSINLIVTLPLDPDLFVNQPLVLTRRIRMRPSLGEAESYELQPVEFGGWVYEPGEGGKSRMPVAEAHVTIVERGLTTQTDEAGRFIFDHVPRGRYTLRADAGSRQIERAIELPGEDYDLVFAADEDTGVKGSAQDPSGRQDGPQKGRRR